MAWLVFGLFFIHSDHAPWWVYAAFIVGYLIDLHKENEAEGREAYRHGEMLDVMLTRDHSCDDF